MSTDGVWTRMENISSLIGLLVSTWAVQYWVNGSRSGVAPLPLSVARSDDVARDGLLEDNFRSMENETKHRFIGKFQAQSSWR